MGKKRVFEENEDGNAVEVTQNDELEVDKQEKNSKATKPLPPGYVCNACGAVGEHAIYNCPSKISKKQKKSSTKDITSSSNTSANDQSMNNEDEAVKPEPTIFPVFVSGLSFDMTKIKLIDLIDDVNGNDGNESKCSLTPKDVILLSFPDNPNKCNGLAYVNCTNVDDYNRTLKINGTPCGKMKITAVPSTQETKRQKSDDERKPKKPKVKSDQKHCYRCGGTDHDPKTCQNERICYRCRETGHLSTECPKRKGGNIPRE